MTEIEQARKRVEELNLQLDAAKAEVYRLELQNANIKLGMLVECAGKIYKVTGAEYFRWDGELPWLRGQLQKKDGSFGQVRTLYRDWKRVDRKSQAAGID